MPFGLRTRVGPRSHVLDGVQIAPCQWVIFRGKNVPDMLNNTAVSCAKWLNQSRCHLGFRLGWAQGSMCWVGCTLVPPGEYHWKVHVQWRCGLLSNYLTTCYYCYNHYHHHFGNGRGILTKKWRFCNQLSNQVNMEEGPYVWLFTVWAGVFVVVWARLAIIPRLCREVISTEHWWQLNNNVVPWRLVPSSVVQQTLPHASPGITRDG